MSVATELANVARYERDVAEVDKKIGAKEKSEADLFKRVNSAAASAARASSVSSANTYLRQADGYQRQIESVKSDKASLYTEKLRKQDQLQQARERLRREQEAERKRIESKERVDRQRAASAQKSADEKIRRQQAEDAKLRQRETSERAVLLAELTALRQRASDTGPHLGLESQAEESGEVHDFFISHASEDKEGFVRSLADALRERGFNVWYDEFSLRVGDNLRRSIDRGIVNSRFGIVVLSPDFFRKEWPQRELDALFALDTDASPRILPIWHKVSFDEVAAASPILANRIALKTAVNSLDDIVEQLADRLA